MFWVFCMGNSNVFPEASVLTSVGIEFEEVATALTAVTEALLPIYTSVSGCNLTFGSEVEAWNSTAVLRVERVNLEYITFEEDVSYFFTCPSCAAERL